MSDENELDKPGGSVPVSPLRPVLSTCGAGRRRCRRHRVSSLGFSCGRRLVLPCLPRRPLPRRLLVRSSSRPVLLALCLSCGLSSGSFVVSACYSPRLVSPYRRIVRLPARSTSWAGRVRGSVCGSVSVRLGCCCLLLVVAVDVAGVLSRGALLVACRVDGV